MDWLSCTRRRWKRLCFKNDKMDLESRKVDKAPSTVYYVPDFITNEEEVQIMQNVYSAPKPKWTQLAHRRLQNWGGIPHPKGMIAEKIPSWLEKYTEKIAHIGVFEEARMPNHVLVNEYLPGQGIMPHSDGPLFYPTVTTITCGSHTVLDFSVPHTSRDGESSNSGGSQVVSLLLERRSLLVLQDEMYHNYLHSIAEIKEDIVTDCIANLGVCVNQYSEGQVLERGTRVSLTIRHVPRTTKLKLCLAR